MWRIGIVLLAAAPAWAEASLEAEVDRYLLEAPEPPAKRVGTSWFSFQANLWLPVVRGTVDSGAGTVDLRDDLDLGFVDQTWQTLAYPAAVACIGAGLGALRNDSRVVTEAAIGAGAFAAVFGRAPEFTAQFRFLETLGARFDTLFLDQSGSEKPSRPYSYGGGSFVPQVTVDAGFRLAQVRLLALWTVVGTAPAKPSATATASRFALSLVAGATWVDCRVRIRQTNRPSGHVDEEGKAGATVILPQAGALVEWQVQNWALEVLAVTGPGSGSRWSDGRAAIAWYIRPRLALRIGYRYVEARLRDDGFAWLGSLDGFYYGFGMRF